MARMLPPEIQVQIIKLCLQDWTARLEQHTKPCRGEDTGVKSTLRIWSSKIYDALMLSLACKEFFSMVQDIQKDPLLFDGTIDLIGEPGAVIYLSEAFRAQNPADRHAPDDPVDKPHLMYKTKVFIKNGPYLSSTKQELMLERREYHTDIRSWLTANVRRLKVMYDEISHDFNPSPFTRLQDLVLYFPMGEEYTLRNLQVLGFTAGRIPLCELEHNKEWPLGHLCSAFNENFHINILRPCIDRGLTITIIWDINHHHCGTNQFALRDSCSCSSHLRFEFSYTKTGPIMRSTTCLKEYARPGLELETEKTKLKKAKSDG